MLGTSEADRFELCVGQKAPEDGLGADIQLVCCFWRREARHAGITGMMYVYMYVSIYTFYPQEGKKVTMPRLHVYKHTSGRTAAEGFSPTSPRAHWIRPESCGQEGSV